MADAERSVFHMTPDNNAGPSQAVQRSDDVCALPIVRRLGATFDIDPGRWREGDALPRGWHLAFFTTDTRQSQLRPDGVAGFGIELPEAASLWPKIEARHAEVGRA